MKLVAKLAAAVAALALSTLAHGNPTIFLNRPISVALLAIALAVLVVGVLPAVRKKREEVFVEED